MMTQNPLLLSPSLIEQQQYKKIKDLQAWMVNSDQAAIDPQKISNIKKLQRLNIKLPSETINMKHIQQMKPKLF